MRGQLAAARAATFGYFVLNGTEIGLWVVHIPAIEARAGVSHATLGSLLFLLGAGAFVGMRLAGPVSDRLGTRLVVPAAGVVCSVGLALPGLATDPVALAIALTLFGIGNGCLDVSMNAHAVLVEKAYRRPVMSAFHATFSVGGVLAAGITALAVAWGVSVEVTFMVAAAIGVVVSIVLAPLLLAGHGGASRADQDVPATRVNKANRRTIRLLAVLALMLMLVEGVAHDWSAVHMVDVLDTGEDTAAAAYGTFATTMTVGRLLGDRVSARFGPAAVLRHGAVIAAVGLTMVALAAWVPLALTGWAVFGAGLSGCAPQLFSVAGAADTARAGANVARVASLGYLGLLAGPAVIGWLTELVPLNYALLFPVVLCASAASATRLLRAPEKV